MAAEYVERRDGGYFIAGSRVSLDSVVYAFLRGESPEGIADSFPAISLEQVLGSLAYYLGNRAAVDRYLSDGRAEFEELRRQSRLDNPALYARFDEARQRSHASAQ